MHPDEPTADIQPEVWADLQRIAMLEGVTPQHLLQNMLRDHCRRRHAADVHNAAEQSLNEFAELYRRLAE